MPKLAKVKKAAVAKKTVGAYSLKVVTAATANPVDDTLLRCVVCDCKLTKERLAALKSLNAPKTRWTCVKDSTVKKVLGQYAGEVGTSDMFLCDRIDEDSVRSMFRKTPAELTDTESREKDDEED
ncbi:MAG: hypothetical protein EBU46_00010 [Nitrosomonadaceae bacterium]|nr:hypothetical protein [Nitrosomonadaceae bacterium]